MKKVFLTLSLVAIFCIAALAEKQVAVLYVPDSEYPDSIRQSPFFCSK